MIFSFQKFKFALPSFKNAPCLCAPMLTLLPVCATPHSILPLLAQNHPTEAKNLESRLDFSLYANVSCSVPETTPNDFPNTFQWAGGVFGWIPFLPAKQSAAQCMVLWQGGIEKLEANQMTLPATQCKSSLHIGLGLRKRLSGPWNRQNILGGSAYYNGVFGQQSWIGLSADWLEQNQFISGCVSFPFRGIHNRVSYLINYHCHLPHTKAHSYAQMSDTVQKLLGPTLLCVELQRGKTIIPDAKVGVILAFPSVFKALHSPLQTTITFELTKWIPSKGCTLNFAGTFLTAFRFKLGLGKNPLLTQNSTASVAYPFLRVGGRVS